MQVWNNNQARLKFSLPSIPLPPCCMDIPSRPSAKDRGNLLDRPDAGSIVSAQRGTSACVNPKNTAKNRKVCSPANMIQKPVG